MRERFNKSHKLHTMAHKSMTGINKEIISDTSHSNLSHITKENRDSTRHTIR